MKKAINPKKQARRWLCYGILTGFIGSFICFVGACQYHHAHKLKPNCAEGRPLGTTC